MGNFARTNGAKRWSAKANPTVPIQVDDVIATITSGANAGQVGPFDLTATDGRQTLANILGVACQRNAAADATGLTERITPNQDNNLIAYYNFVPAADANSGYIYISPVPTGSLTGTRTALSAETGLTTQTYLAGKGFLFVTEVPA